ncbi:unnamed protein product [Dovyalis caffra]|uniref:Uncharacterized protein n=1 Tax=Dovyalis caffra TaxID=77055 RepID=A0AAV1S823_9ROSI|nr:unnamed protein product [Dovyalis caffra]
MFQRINCLWAHSIICLTLRAADEIDFVASETSYSYLLRNLPRLYALASLALLEIGMAIDPLLVNAQSIALDGVQTWHRITRIAQAISQCSQYKITHLRRHV